MMRSFLTVAVLLFLAPVLWAAGTAPVPPPSSLKILEADGSTVTLTATRSSFEDSLYLVNQTDKEQTITLTVSDLRAEAGHTAHLTLPSPGPLHIGARQAQQVPLKGDLPEVGIFKGHLTVVVQGSTQPLDFLLVVKRDKGTQQIAVDAQPEPPVTRALSGTTAEVRLQLTETTGAAAHAERPVLLKLVQEVSSTYKAGAKLDGWQLLQSDGKALPDDPAQLTLPAYGAKNLLLRIDGLRDTGKYEGTVQVATPNGALTQTFTLFVKDPWLFAALVILAGVWLSFWYRRWLLVGRPQALGELRISRLLQRIQIEIPNAVDPIRKGLEGALQELFQTSLIDSTTDIGAGIDKVTAELDNYRVVASVLGLRSQLAPLFPDPEKRAAMERRLAALDQGVTEGGLRALANQDGKNPLADQAQAIRQDLLSGAAQALGDSLATLKQNVQTERDALAKSTLPAADRDALLSQLKAADDLIAKANGELTISRESAAQTAVDALRRGWEAYQEAGRLYLAVSDRVRRQHQAQADNQLEALTPPAVLAKTPNLPRLVEPVRDPADILQDILHKDAVVAWIVTVVSVIVGLRALWVPTEAFGSLADYIGAFVWGFGLHELNKIATPDALTKLGLVFPSVKGS